MSATPRGAGVAEHAIDADFAGEVMGPGIEFGHVPLGTDHTYWFATQRAPEGQAAPQGELAYLKATFGSWAEPIPTVLAATDPDAVLRNDLYDRDQARQWSRGPVVGGRRRGPPDASASGPGRVSGH